MVVARRRDLTICLGITEALTVARHFPSKRLLFNMDPEIVEERREELQLWMLVRSGTSDLGPQATDSI